LDLRADFTIGTWVRFNHLPTTGASRNPRIVQKSADTGTAGSYYLSVRTGTTSVLSLRLKFGGTTYTLDGVQGFTTSRWYHVAAVKEGSAVRLYVDGVQDGATSRSRWPLRTRTTIPLYRGIAHELDGAVDGAIEDLRLYARALSASEIVATKDAELTGTERA